jgi:hypothetical protein
VAGSETQIFPDWPVAPRGSSRLVRKHAVLWCLIGSDGHGAARVEDKEAVLEMFRADIIVIENSALTREPTFDARATAQAATSS